MWESTTKVLAAEGHKGVPLDPDLADLLQGLLKLDSRHRLSARDALASAYFTPRPGLLEERVSVHEHASVSVIFSLQRRGCVPRLCYVRFADVLWRKNTKVCATAQDW